MLKEIVLAVIPAIVSSTLTYFLNKNSKRVKSKKTKYVKRRIKFLDITHWFILNMLDIMSVMTAFAFMYVAYVLYKRLFNPNLVNLYPFISPIVYTVSAIVLIMWTVDTLFNQNIKK